MRMIAAITIGLWLSATADGTPQVQLAARGVQPGEIVLLTVTTARAAERVEAEAFGAPVPGFRIDDRTWRLLVGIDLDVAPGPYSITIRVAGDAAPISQSLTVQPKTFPTRRLLVPEAYVSPPPAVQARIAAEAKRLAAIWNTSAVERLWSAPFVRPVPHPANSAFGTRSVFNGQPRSPHGGADFSSPAGAPVHAPNAGRVVLADDLYYTGGTVVIDHGLGLVSLFAHLSRIDVTEESLVEPRQVIGRVGATGRVTGPHLHWTVRLGGARVDPLSLLSVLGG
jgi:murein DD-endopeptidase MepM/ murein hydrolase activator NlpD